MTGTLVFVVVVVILTGGVLMLVRQSRRARARSLNDSGERSSPVWTDRFVPAGVGVGSFVTGGR